MKKLKFLAAAAITAFLVTSCDGNKGNAVHEDHEEHVDHRTTPSDYDPQRGLGMFDESNVDVSTFSAERAKEGERIAEVKCTSCHKPTDERLVGPGWKGVTNRHTPYWIMNFITNPDPMIDVDPDLQAQLEICLVRMPNQGLNNTEARDILEYMRQIDGAH